MLPPTFSNVESCMTRSSLICSAGEGGGNPRMGAYENGSVFLAYWFPRIAVYDDVRGWDLLPYDGENEFYHDYGNMRVSSFEEVGTGPRRRQVWVTTIG